MTNRRTRSRERETSGGAKRSLVAAVALFVVLCGVGLALFGGTPDAEAEAQAGPSPEARAATAALDRTERAERALMERDYGEARRHVREARRILAELNREEESAADDAAP